jgi:hypothetical protein
MRRRTLLAAVAVTLLLAAPAQAETIVVNQFADLGDPSCPGPTCTLRAALARAISTGNAEPDEIVLDAGPYTLNSILDMSNAGNAAARITITGRGANQTSIQPRADGNFRVLVTAANASLTLRNLTVRNGRDVQNPGGNLTVNTNTILNLDGVRVTGGTGVSGGGISGGTGSTMNIANSLIDTNSAPTGTGGGITSRGTVNLTDSTVAFNRGRSVGGIAMLDASGAATLRGVTLAYNGTTSGQPPTAGGIQSAAAPVTLQGSLIAGNTSTQDTANGTVVLTLNCGIGGTVTDEGGNIEDSNYCKTSSGTFTNPQLATALDETLEPPALPIAATSPAIDIAECGARTLDQRRLARPQGLRCDAGAFEAVPVTQPPPTQTPTPVPTPAQTPQPTPTPVVNQTIVVDEVKGAVKIKLPGTSKFVDLDAVRGIPVGSTVDAKKGTVRLTSIPKPGGKPETAIFYDGIFRVSQSRGITNLTLVEALAACPRKRANAAAAKPKKRRLWGEGKGNFRTSGKYAAATVRGTKWLVEDSCAGTLTRVTQGSVTVSEGRKRIIVRAGKRYLAKARR